MPASAEGHEISADDLSYSPTWLFQKCSASEDFQLSQDFHLGLALEQK